MDKTVKTIPFHLKRVKEDDGTVKYLGVASSDALDRDREILVPKGMDTANFEKNPVMLLGHDYYGLPIGKVHRTGVTEEEVDFEFEFADTDEARTVKSLYDGGFMNAFSVSFIPKKYIDVSDNSPEKLEITLADGSLYTLDLGKYVVQPRGVISEWELLEISAVSIPANPEAIIRRSFDVAMGAIEDPAKKKLFKTQNEDLVTGLIEQVKGLVEGFEDPVVKGAVPIHQTPIVEGDFDRESAKVNLAVFASEDNSGSKESLDWGLYSRGFGWLDEAKMGLLSGYKYCHHDIEDGKLVGNWKGIQASMKKLLGDVDQIDREEIYKHLVQHYDDFDRIAPELKEYMVDELENLPEVMKGKVGESETILPFQTGAGIEEIKLLIDGHFKELEETLICRLGVLASVIAEQTLALEKGFVIGANRDTGNDDDHDDKTQLEIDKGFEEVSTIFKQLMVE